MIHIFFTLETFYTFSPSTLAVMMDVTPAMRAHITKLAGVLQLPSTLGMPVLRQLSRTFRSCPQIQVFLSLPSTVDNLDVELLADAYSVSVDPGARALTQATAPALLHAHNLCLAWSGVVDVACLSHLHTLDLSGTAVSDVSALGHVHTLILAHCYEVRDVHGLGQNVALCLRHSPVSDVSSLGRVHTLDLGHPRVTDVSALGGVTALSLRYTAITDVSALVHVPVLDLTHTPLAALSRPPT